MSTTAEDRVAKEDPRPFVVTDDLPTGTVLLEASAGTGKTWTIGALVTRMVAEAHARLDEMLVVTFGRAASQELRERVRAQLVEAELVLSDDPAADESGVADSDLVTLLRGYGPELRRLAHARVVAALTGFDAATIATTHQFCSLVLDALGVAGDTDTASRLVEDLDELVRETVDDLYLRAFAFREEPVFSHAEALAIARDAMRDPRVRLEPAEAPADTPAGRKVSFARAVLTEVEHRKRRLGVLSYDDLLVRLADALDDPDGAARQRMQRRWRVVLVDEFQDTDPVQWEVLDRAFTGVATMVLIGDPKQAIYAFRGGDLATYLRAAATADSRRTLAVNRRSDSALLDGLQTLLGGAALGDDEVVVRDVVAHHHGSRLAPGDPGVPGADPVSLAPFRLRVLRRADVPEGRKPLAAVGDVRPKVVADLARDVRRLLASGATWDGRRLEARDVAVLAHKRDQLEDCRRALAEVGVPAVVAGGGSVFLTEGAGDWLTLLEALEQPHRSARVRSAALTPFLGHTVEDLDERGDDLTDEVAELLRSWVDLCTRRGVAAVLEAATQAGMPARLLAVRGGERRLTDLRHVGEALHEAALADRLGPVALLTWLRQHVADAVDGPGGERVRRLDSDAAAVQLVTIHGSKGLQYPVVYLPSLADRYPREPARPLFHADDGARSRNLAGSGPGFAEHLQRAMTEDAGESLRLLYVALTRAQSQVVAWWAPTGNATTSPLHRLLAREDPAAPVPDAAGVPGDDELVELLRRWRERGGPSPEVSTPAEPAGALEPEADPELGVRRFGRRIDAEWRRSSYSSLSRRDGLPAAAATEPAVGSEPEEPGTVDEPLDVTTSATAAAEQALAGDVASPMAELPTGATFGSLVHGVLEHADPAAADWRAELELRVAEQLVRWPVDLDTDRLVDALVGVCDTPLGPLAGDVRLRDLPLAGRLAEMDFELPLAGGDDAEASGPVVRLGDLAPLLEDLLPVDDPVRPYAAALRGPLGEQPLRGYLTGSVDVVLRVGAGEAERYLVVDYKTNWLGPFDEPLTAGAYRPAALREAMTHSDYPLQALLYAVVLHRFLRWRLAGYDLGRHLGGVLYLYLRGMCGPTTPVVDGQPCGVFTWRPPVALVEAVSDLLDGAPASASASASVSRSSGEGRS